MSPGTFLEELSFVFSTFDSDCQKTVFSIKKNTYVAVTKYYSRAFRAFCKRTNSPGERRGAIGDQRSPTGHNRAVSRTVLGESH